MKKSSFTKNILNCYEEATVIEREDGRSWYNQAEEWARKICPTDVPRGAGVIAALSPRQTWDVNKKAAAKIVRAVDDFSNIIPTVAGTYANIDKAWRIANGENPVTVLGQSKRNFKVFRFFKNITGDTNVVTVDLWAARAAYPACPTPFIRGKLYLTLEACYQAAARRVGGISPRDLQAVCWIHTRGSAE
jgi:hypothetical protein